MSNDWESWSKHILTDLERQNTKQEELRSKLEEIKHDITKIENMYGDVEDLKNWRNKISETITPDQMKNLINDVEKLKSAKIMIWTALAIGHAALMILIRMGVL